MTSPDDSEQPIVMTRLGIVERLVQMGASICVPCRAIGGTYYLDVATTEDAELWMRSRIEFACKRFDTTEDVYLEWCERNGSVRCTARTKAGRQCKNNATGLQWLEINEFKQKRGTAYCSIHGDASS